jgi:hypothetical protein
MSLRTFNKSLQACKAHLALCVVTAHEALNDLTLFFEDDVLAYDWVVLLQLKTLA